ncbi:succinate-semialdehyde dehydrogenase [Pedobacter yonginense]|uniref:Succinate-semialdehyde dehydrogenase n=1 Tax=Pedobacter yonginense TaxID=651869 RepID=A0A317ETU6_9SPHI|nr:NAD-dependent succinate-semialdehyde dehydrogenase [Pedobacter yonginense]PWS29323.1 succinate-semialdehyde dehydrogenase [Pedobacter yonginense]
MIFKSINPYTLETFLEHQLDSDNQVDRKLSLANSAYLKWKSTPFEHRSECLMKAASIFRRDKEIVAQMITAEMGKIIGESRAEVEKSASNLEFYAQNAASYLEDTVVDMGLYKSVISYDAIGTVFAIMPWNYPIWQVLRYVAPCLMSGNTTILKHAPNVLGCAKLIEKIFLEAGIPEGVFQNVFIDVPQVERVIAHDSIQLVTLTGSEMAGSSVASLAGKHIKKSILELGGSDAFIVLADANIEKAVQVAVNSRMMNAGQACICAKRFIVEEAVSEEFTQLFQQKISQLSQGNPLDENTNLGPLARIDLANQLKNQLNESINQGANLIFGGKQDNCNFTPTLVTNVSENNPVFQQESFGPLAAITSCKNQTEAVQMANNHRYGLATAIWTADLEKAYQLARQIESGNVFVNSLVRSDSRISFGGVKKSGYGRELGILGIRELTNVKSIIIEN